MERIGVSMRKWWKRPRKIVVGETVYRYSLLDWPQYRELRVYREREKRLTLRLRLTYPETWAIDLFRPKAVAYIIGWHEGKKQKEPAVLTLRGEPDLFQGLLDLFFRPEEQARWMEDGRESCGEDEITEDLISKFLKQLA